MTEYHLFTPNALSKCMGPEFEIVTESLKRFFSALSQEQRREVYDQIRQCKFEGDVAFKKLIKRYPEIKECVDIAMHANMLTDSDMIECDLSEVEILHKKLNRCYVRLTKDLYKSYALHIKDGYFISVAHCFDKVEDQLILSDNGNRFAAVVVKILRERDLAVIRCDLLKALPKSLQYFASSHEEMPLYAHFMRCGPTMSLLTGGLEYKEYQEFIGKVCDNEYYKPSTEILKLRRAGLRVLDVVSKGDCGFPFIGKIRGSLRILGIHNAYINEGVIFGSFISSQLLKELLSSPFPNALALSTPVVLKIPIVKEDMSPSTLEMSMPIEYADVFDRSIKPDPRMPVDSPLKSIGYHTIFANPSKLKEKHKTHDLELITPNLQLPAAFNLNYVTDFSDIVKNGFGRYDPLLTQAFKYKFSNCPIDLDAYKLAEQIVQDYNLLTYCSEGPLRIITEYEAINGMRRPFLANFDITTSAGPYAKYFGNAYFKKDIFNVTMHNGVPEYTFNSSPIAQSIRNNMKQQKKLLFNKHIPPCLISQDNAKVEMIEKEKALKGKVRLFNNIDPSINAILKMLFGHWFAQTMTKSADGYYAIGQNPYTTSTEIWHRFSTKDGKILNTDFRAFDKTLHPRLIKSFCKIACSLMKVKPKYNKEAIYEAISKTLIHAVHLLDGSIYVVNNGNESGTFVTTLLNCVCAHIIFTYTFIKCWQRIPKYINIKVTLKSIMQYSELAILGDDTTRKVSSEIPITEHDLFYYAKELGTECTKAKSGEDTDNIDFCSRTFYWCDKDQIVYPRLKQCSIFGLLRWFAEFSKNQIRNNLMVALFEASMYDIKFYQDVLQDSMTVCNHYDVDIRTVPFTNYEMARARLKSMLLNDCEYQDLTALANRNQIFESDIHNITVILKQNLLNTASAISANPERIESIVNQHKADNKTSKALQKWALALNEDKMVLGNPTNNPVSDCLELISKLKTEKPTERYTSEGPSNSPTHSCTITYNRKQFGGEGPSKASAKNQAYGALREYLRDNIVVNAVCEDQASKSYEAIKKVAIRATALLIEHHISQAKANSMGRPSVILVSKRSYNGDISKIDGFDRFLLDGHCYFLSPIIQELGRTQAASCYLRYPGITMNSDREIIMDLRNEHRSYSLRNVEEEKDYDDGTELIYVNATKEEGESLGGVLNDIPPAASTNILLDSENSLHMPIVMNYSGPSNALMNAGGINFNIMDLVYGQFVASEYKLDVDGTKDRGQVLAVVPYDPINNSFINDYIKNYCYLHDRCAGSWLLCVSSAGNKSMIGSLGFSWQPTIWKGTTIAMAEATKYSFFTTSVSESFSYTIAMTDARQSEFYRTLVRDSKGKSSMTETPSIVIFVHTKSQPVFTEKRATTVNFYSKLASNVDAAKNPAVKPFIASNPMLAIKQTSETDKTSILNF
nr:MAG: RNA-dependent RNA polymerase [Hubei picorna-like virus 56]